MGTTIRPLGSPGDLGWVVMAHGEDYAAELGWDADFEALVARIVADFTSVDAGRAGAWIAELDGDRVGCVFCVPYDERTAQLRILLVRPPARGRGLGGALVDTCLDFARTNGYQRVLLWTNDVLAAARRIYLERGFRLVD
jgi:GNAT superfamily N-acetyltransferase